MGRWAWSVAAVLLLACGATDRSSGPRPGTLADALGEVRHVILEDTPEATIGRLTDILPLRDRILVADRTTSRVLAFSLQGDLIGWIGGEGDGPGEFRRPHHLIEDVDGSVLVADVSQRVTRLTPDLELLDVYRLEVPNFVGGLSRVGDRLVVHLVAPRLEGDNFAFWSPSSGLGGSFDPRNPLVREVPYWNAVLSARIASLGDRVFVADNMVYPLRVYSRMLEFVDTAGFAPESWKQASRPELGQFTGPGQRGAQEWLRSFTRIDRLTALGDDRLLVSHREPTNEYESDDMIRLDVYDTKGPVVKLWEDIDLPGPVLAGGECAWVVTARPPGPWALSCYKLLSP